MAQEYFLILMGTVLVNNIVLIKVLGLCPFMGVSKKLETSIAMAAATTFVLTIGSGTSYLISHYLLGTEMFLEKTSPVLYQSLGIFLPLITTNCAVLGIPLLNVQSNHNFIESLLFGLGGAIGFSMVLIMFASLRERLDAADIPAPFKGSAIAMITAGLMSLAFMGFAGLVR